MSDRLALLGIIAVFIPAALTAVFTFFSARSSAKTAAATTRFVGQSDRFADWQMHKRKVYSKLLSSIREATDTKGRQVMGQSFDAAILTAYDSLRIPLMKLYSDIAAKPVSTEELLTPTEYQQLVDLMTVDVNRTPTMDKQRRQAQRA